MSIDGAVVDCGAPCRFPDDLPLDDDDSAPVSTDGPVVLASRMRSSSLLLADRHRPVLQHRYTGGTSTQNAAAAPTSPIGTSSITMDREKKRLPSGAPATDDDPPSMQSSDSTSDDTDVTDCIPANSPSTLSGHCSSSDDAMATVWMCEKTILSAVTPTFTLASLLPAALAPVLIAFSTR